MRRATMGILLAAAALALPIAGCGDRGANPWPGGDEVVMRAYDVPDGVDVEEVRKVIARSLTRGDTSFGGVATYPNGTLVVTAPESVQSGVAAVIAEIGKKGASAGKALPAPFAVRYWVLLARPTGGETKVAGVLRDDSEAKTAIDAITGSQGPMEFALVERARLESVLGREASLRGRRLQIQQRVVGASGDAAVAQISVAVIGSQGKQHGLETWTRLDPGKVVVLGQAAYNAAGSVLPPGWRDADDVTVYFVLASERE